MKNLRPVPWTSLRPGAVVDAWVPYDDGPGYKRRPAVVVEATKSGVILFPITTKVHRVAWRPGYVLALAREAGLRERRSAVLWRTVVVDRVEVLSLRGRLAGADHEEFLRQVGRC